MVQFRTVSESGDWLAGLFDFRGKLLPLIDSARLLDREPSEIRMATRILVIRTSDQTEAAGDEQVGLIVERVLGSDNVDFDQNASCRPSTGIEFLGTVAKTKNVTVQLTIPARLPTVQV